MRNEVEMMSAEEFLFGDGNEGKNSSSACRTRGKKKSEANLFDRIKVKMVMRIYGVSRAKALEIIAKREAGDATSAKGGAHGDGMDRRDDDSLMTPEEFFA